MKQEVDILMKKLSDCPKGHLGWMNFEKICIKILCYLFVPPLTKPKLQRHSYAGYVRRDAVFPNRNRTTNNNWGLLFKELNARMIPFEFKNYNSRNIELNQVNQIRNYLTKPMGRLAFLCSSKEPSSSALIHRCEIFNCDKKIILFLTKDDLVKMLLMKNGGEAPSNYILDILEWFYIDPRKYCGKLVSRNFRTSSNSLNLSSRKIIN